MNYRKLGNTDLWVSEIGFGTIPILKGEVGVLPDYYDLGVEEAVSVMQHAYALGCNLYDTAIVPEYGDAEYKLGVFAAGLADRSSIVIADKARCYSGSDMYDAVLRSSQHLGTKPDIYFVHQVEAEQEEEVFGRYGALDALAELKAEGIITFTGIASHYYQVLYHGARDSRVDVLQGSGNLLERGMLDRMEQEPLFRNKGLLINKVYAAGILPAFLEPHTLIEGVLSYPISSALIGIGTKEQADAAMRMEYGRNRLTFSEVMAVLERWYRPIPCDRCQRCLCPYGTDIATVLRQYHYYHLGKDYWAMRKLDLGIRESAKRCSSCTDMPCMMQCPKRIRIPDEIERIRELVDIRVKHGWIS